MGGAPPGGELHTRGTHVFVSFFTLTCTLWQGGPWLLSENKVIFKYTHTQKRGAVLEQGSGWPKMAM